MKLKCLYQFAQTYEAQDKLENAIDKLNLITTGFNNADNINSEESYSKAFLNLGRLYFKMDERKMPEKNKLADKNLNSFFKESKKHESKELVDLARVNLGMIKGTIGFEDLVRLMKTSSYQDFLRTKLKFFSDT